MYTWKRIEIRKRKQKHYYFTNYILSSYIRCGQLRRIRNEIQGQNTYDRNTKEARNSKTGQAHI